MIDNIIEIKDLCFNYSDDENVEVVIDKLNLNIERGSFTVILGHNGSGKSTLAKLLNGMYKPTNGKIIVCGMDTSEESNEIDIKRKVGLVFQNPDNQLVASIVEEDVAFGPENLGLEPEVIRERVDNALKAVNMYDYREHSPNRLSGGQKQRIAIAGIIAMEPDCLVFDEPTAMLDPKGRAEVIEAIMKLNRERGITVILITHYMNEAENADRVVVMNDGKIAADGTPKQVFVNADLLHSFGLDVPQTAELNNKLKSLGYNVDLSAISVDECAEELFKIIGKGV